MHSLFHVLGQNRSDAIVVLDSAGAILFASESATRIGGYTLSERGGRRAFEMMHPDDIAATRASFEECVRRPGVPVRGAFRLRHKDGGWRHIESIAVNRLGDPAVAGIVVNYRDVTEQRLAVEALRASEERLGPHLQGAHGLV